MLVEEEAVFITMIRISLTNHKMDINSISLRELIIALIVTGCIMGTLFPIFSWWLGYVITRYIKRQDSNSIETNLTLMAINKTLSELHTITKVHEEKHESHEFRLEKLEDAKDTLIVKYNRKK